jgi:hypothetical protein
MTTAIGEAAEGLGKPAERLSYPIKEPVNRRDERRKTKPPQDPPQPPGRRDVLEHTDPRRTVHQPDPGRLDELPRFLDLVLRDADGIGRGRLVVPAQERQSLPAINLATSLAAARQNGQPPSNSKSGRRGGGTFPSHERSNTKRSMGPHIVPGRLAGIVQYCGSVAWGGQSADACSNPRPDQAELLQPPKGVHQRPHVDDPAVPEPEDPDLIDPLEATPGGYRRSRAGVTVLLAIAGVLGAAKGGIELSCRVIVGRRGRAGRRRPVAGHG